MVGGFTIDVTGNDTPWERATALMTHVLSRITTLDVRLVLKTDDDAVIVMTYRGVRHGPTDVITRMERGEAVDPEAMFRLFFKRGPLQFVVS